MKLLYMSNFRLTFFQLGKRVKWWYFQFSHVRLKMQLLILLAWANRAVITIITLNFLTNCDLAAARLQPDPIQWPHLDGAYRHPEWEGKMCHENTQNIWMNNSQTAVTENTSKTTLHYVFDLAFICLSSQSHHFESDIFPSYTFLYFWVFILSPVFTVCVTT